MKLFIKDEEDREDYYFVFPSSIEAQVMYEYLSFGATINGVEILPLFENVVFGEHTTGIIIEIPEYDFSRAGMTVHRDETMWESTYNLDPVENAEEVMHELISAF